MNTLKRAAALLKSMEWQYRPYSASWNIESGYYCPACGGKENDGHAENCELLAVITELDRMAQSEPVNHQMLEALKELRDAYQEFMGVPAVKANAAIAAAEESLTVERRAAPVNQQMLAEVVALLERHQKWLNKLPVPTAGETYQMMNVVGKAIDTLAGMAEENHQAEPVAGQCKFSCESKWLPCSVEHHYHVLSCPDEWPGYETRLLYAAPQPSSPPGWKLVPVEPTSKMIVAGAEADPQFFTHAQFVYRAMLAAAPEKKGGAA